MNEDEMVRKLNLFNSKVNELLNSSFLKKGETGFHISWKRGEGFETVLKYAGDDALRSFVLTIRFFVQNNDDISLQKIKEIYDELEDKIKREYNYLRDSLNDYLDSNTHIIYNGEKLTRKKVFKTFLYGHLAHLNKEKRRLYANWKKIPPLFVSIKNQFLIILYDFLNVLYQIKLLNEKVISDING